MVQADPRKNTFRMIPKINAFLSKHSTIVAIVIDHVVKFLAVTMILVAVAIFCWGTANILFWNQPMLGVFQLLFLLAYHKWQMARLKTSEMHNDLHTHQETIGGLVDVIQKTAAPHAYFSPLSPKKKSDLPN